MERQLTEIEMAEIAIDLLLIEMDEAREEGDAQKADELAQEIEKKIDCLNGNTVYFRR